MKVPIKRDRTRLDLSIVIKQFEREIEELRAYGTLSDLIRLNTLKNVVKELKAIVKE